jgi:cell filamentation protein
MSKYDIYLYDDCNVLENLLNIKDEQALDLAEAELSRANMMILYEKGFSNFSQEGIYEIHKFLFGDIYRWAGSPRIINLQKREPILAGKSVWYSDCDNIHTDLEKAWMNINSVNWRSLTRQEFVKKIARLFPAIWQVHPFREGNGRAQREFARELCMECGYVLDLTETTHQEMLDASIASFNRGDNTGFISIFSRVVIPYDEYRNYQQKLNSTLLILSKDDM